MIDTHEKLEVVINTHKYEIVAKAMEEFIDCADDDVWGTYWVSAEDQIDFNAFKPEEEEKIHVWAFALRSTPDEAPYVLQVNTSIGYLVATLDFAGKL